MKEQKRNKFDEAAKTAGWEVFSDYGDGAERNNPDGSAIYDGVALFKNGDGEIADVWYIAALLGLSL